MKVREVIEALDQFDPDDDCFVMDPGIKALVPITAVAESAVEGEEGAVIYIEE